MNSVNLSTDCGNKASDTSFNVSVCFKHTFIRSIEYILKHSASKINVINISFYFPFFSAPLILGVLKAVRFSICTPLV